MDKHHPHDMSKIRRNYHHRFRVFCNCDFSKKFGNSQKFWENLGTFPKNLGIFPKFGNFPKKFGNFPKIWESCLIVIYSKMVRIVSTKFVYLMCMMLNYRPIVFLFHRIASSPPHSGQRKSTSRQAHDFPKLFGKGDLGKIFEILGTGGVWDSTRPGLVRWPIEIKTR